MHAPIFRSLFCAVLSLVLLPLPGYAWGNVGHRLINRLAASSLPSDVPAFLRSPSAIDEIEYLGPEPDRWRSRAEPELEKAQALEHYIDLEPADALGQLPHNRLDFEQLAFAHHQRPESIGLQPWQTVEVWERLKAALREYRRLSATGPAGAKDLAGVQQAAIFYAGWLGHYVGDGSQPLHTTINHDGWTQPENPKGFSTARGIHSRFETAFVASNEAALAVSTAKKLTESKAVTGDIFDSYLAYLRHSYTFIDQVYTLDQAGAFTTATPDSLDFTATRLAAGSSELRDLIYTAWLESAKPIPARD